MSRSAIHFQGGLSLPEFQRLYCSDAQYESALEKACWPDGFRCPRCQAASMGWSMARGMGGQG